MEGRGAPLSLVVTGKTLKTVCGGSCEETESEPERFVVTVSKKLVGNLINVCVQMCRWVYGTAGMAVRVAFSTTRSSRSLVSTSETCFSRKTGSIGTLGQEFDADIRRCR